MKVLLYFLAFFVISINAQSEQVERILTWDAVTTRTDNSPLPSSEIKSYTVCYNINSSIDTCMELIDVADTTEHTIILNLPFSVNPYTIRAAVYATDIYGSSGELSEYGEMQFEVKPSPPSPANSVRFIVE